VKVFASSQLNKLSMVWLKDGKGIKRFAVIFLVANNRFMAQ